MEVEVGLIGPPQVLQESEVIGSSVSEPPGEGHPFFACFGRDELYGRHLELYARSFSFFFKIRRVEE